MPAWTPRCRRCPIRLMARSARRTCASRLRRRLRGRRWATMRRLHRRDRLHHPHRPPLHLRVRLPRQCQPPRRQARRRRQVHRLTTACLSRRSRASKNSRAGRAVRWTMTTWLRRARSCARRFLYSTRWRTARPSPPAARARTSHVNLHVMLPGSRAQLAVAGP